jgi:hypothetical protein
LALLLPLLALVGRWYASSNSFNISIYRIPNHAAAPQESNQKARIVSFAPDTDLPDHDCGELFAFFKGKGKERET